MAAFLLKSQGLDVRAVSLQFFCSANITESQQFCHVEKLKEVKSICDQLDIPLYAVDAKAEFQSKILDQMTAARLSGHFFSTCMECHRIKFQLLHEKAKKLQCPYISTGHFAKVHHNDNGEIIEIYRADDQENDQSHLLSRVEQKYLQNLILPLGNLGKKEVLNIAKRYQFEYLKPYKRNKNCFFTEEQILSYISEHTHKSLQCPVNLFDNKQQIYLSYKTSGIHYFYLGQQNIKSSDKYQKIDQNLVVTKICMNSKKVILDTKEELNKKQMKVGRLNFRSDFDRSKPCHLYVKFETGPFHKASIFFKSNNTVIIEFSKNIYNRGKGHVAIFYNDTSKKGKIMGTGIVEEFTNFIPIIQTPSFNDKSDKSLKDASAEDIIYENKCRF